MVKELTKEMFEEYFEYDPESPSGLRWKVDRYSGRYHKNFKRELEMSRVQFKNHQNKELTITNTGLLD